MDLEAGKNAGCATVHVRAQQYSAVGDSLPAPSWPHLTGNMVYVILYVPRKLILRAFFYNIPDINVSYLDFLLVPELDRARVYYFRVRSYCICICICMYVYMYIYIYTI